MKTTFNVIDIETANQDRSSICQIGIVRVQNGQIVDQWKSLINPECEFHSKNISIHHINSNDVKNSPTLPEIEDELRTRLHESMLISHTSFDKIGLNRAMRRYHLEPLQVKWLDSVEIAKRAWPEYKQDGGYSLGNLTLKLGISFKHHDALEDATATAKIVLLAYEKLGQQSDPIFTDISHKPVIVYISDTRKTTNYLLDDTLNRPEGDKQPNFHFLWCETIRDMDNDNRYSRYISSRNTSGRFKVQAREESGTTHWIENVKLYVCRKCLSETNYKNYNNSTKEQQTRIAEEFNIKEFLEKNNKK